MKRAAPELLAAAKSALRFFLDPGHDPESKKKEVIDRLVHAVDLADGIDPDIATIEFVVTPNTANSLVKAVAQAEHTVLAQAINKGVRFTERRAYIKMDSDTTLLRELQGILRKGTGSFSTDKAFRRMAAQIDREVLSKSPLEWLANEAL